MEYWEWAKRNNDEVLKLLDSMNKGEIKTQKEKDIWNLKYTLFSINKGSFAYNFGVVKTLRRIIKKLEREGYGKK